jgi:hypothetical protein
MNVEITIVIIRLKLSPKGTKSLPLLLRIEFVDHEEKESGDTAIKQSHNKDWDSVCHVPRVNC